MNAQEPENTETPGPVGHPELMAHLPLNIHTALNYVNSIKAAYSDRPEKYEEFLRIMSDYSTQGLEVDDILEQVTQLFSDHPELIEGFNTFLPAGHAGQA